MIGRPATAARVGGGDPCAFTLVELLVVIAVVAVLTGLALPAVQSARLSASQVVAASALHQLAAAGQGYLADHGSVYWPFRSDDANGTTYWFGYETAADAALPEGQRTYRLQPGRARAVQWRSARYPSRPAVPAHGGNVQAQVQGRVLPLRLQTTGWRARRN